MQFIYIYYQCIPHVCLDCNLMQPHDTCGVSDIFALQTTGMSGGPYTAFPMGEKDNERRLGGVAGM